MYWFVTPVERGCFKINQRCVQVMKVHLSLTSVMYIDKVRPIIERQAVPGI